jgi:hypothetical protein
MESTHANGGDIPYYLFPTHYYLSFSPIGCYWFYAFGDGFRALFRVFGMVIY